ncbi:tetratricopeptide repeat protein [Dactylosporangium sp. CA-139066]|uniref:tetratricopeptide repeat protein n=1 Tax=Dactylosporangium sp. CA-139066 TaxID=3239930 RepID=UPI003D8C4A30
MALVVSDSTVRLAGAGVDVSASHGGVRPGLRNALYDVWLRRGRRGDLTSRPRDGSAGTRDVLPETDDVPGSVSLRRAGRLLAESFLPGPVAAGLRGLLERAARDYVPLRIGVDAPGLAGLPWEALPEPVSGQPLALHPQVVVYRRSGAAGSGRLAGPLRIVVAIASPDTGGGPLLDYERELRAVLAAVRGARQHQARVEVVPFATTRAIRAALDVPGGVHVLHISAHGKPGVLLLEDEDGAAREVTAEQLLEEAIPPGRMPPVLALAACYTDVTGEQQGPSFAAQLAGRGACAVIGTQTSVTDRYATLLFARVYAELAASGDPDVVRAVADARRMVQRELLAGGDRAAQMLAGMDEWGVVTLLAGAPEVPVVDHGVPRVPAPAVRTSEWGPVAARPVGQFVGRRALQRQLPALLAGDDIAGLVLHGIGGVGKTTLAAEVLRRTLDADPGWRVVSLFGPVSVDAVLAAVAGVARRELLVRQAVAGPATVAVQAAGQVELPWTDRLALLHDHVLDDVPILLVLDNFEDNLNPDNHTIADPDLAGLLAAWAAAPGRSRLLLTSRHPIALPDGAEGRLLAVPVGPLSAAETGKLLWSLPQVDRHATTEAATEQIWRSVGGHPRSLEYLDALLGQGQGRFDDITDRLTRAVTERLGPHASAAWLAQDRTLDAAVADTVTLAADDVLLTEHLHRLAAIPGAIDLLTAISVYREPVPTLALTFHTGVRRPAEHLTADDTARQAIADQITELSAEDTPLAPADVAAMRQLLAEAASPPRSPYTEPGGLGELLQALAGSSLIHHDLDRGTVFMHRWTATELHDRWQRTPTLDPNKDPLRRAHHTAAEYWQWRAQTWPQDRTTDLHDRLEARHHLLAAGDLDTAGAVTAAICTTLENIGAWDRATGLIHDTLRWLPTDSPHYPNYIHRLGTLARRRGDYAEAERRYQQALTMLEQLGNQAGIATSYHSLGMLAQRRGDYAEAERRYQQSLTIKEQLGNQVGLASSYGQLGTLAQRRGDYTEAERRYQQALASFEQLGHQAGIAASHHQLSMLAQDRGDYTEAERRYQQSLAMLEQLGDQAGIAASHHQLGILAQDRGDYAEAERRYQQSLASFEQLGDQAALASSYGQLGMLAHDRGDNAEAERRYQQSLTMLEQLGNQAGIATSCHQLGMLAQARGDYAEAERRYQQSLTIKKQLGNQAGLATGLSQLGILRSETGHPTEAVQLHIQAAAIRLAIGSGQANIDLNRLAELRTAVGGAAFADIAMQLLDPGSYQALVHLLDTIT